MLFIACGYYRAGCGRGDGGHVVVEQLTGKGPLPGVPAAPRHQLIRYTVHCRLHHIDRDRNVSEHLVEDDARKQMVATGIGERGQHPHLPHSEASLRTVCGDLLLLVDNDKVLQLTNSRAPAGARGRQDKDEVLLCSPQGRGGGLDLTKTSSLSAQLLLLYIAPSFFPGRSVMKKALLYKCVRGK
ncbi:hypothetical protein J6590_025359 [Homalodisca vitripennis]|nr:hypothetical protein J6590_025359 [Homalodisca vitripennis]